MTKEQLRLECAKLAMPEGIANPDMDMVIAKAQRLYAFVAEDNELARPQTAPNQKAAKKSGQAA